MIILMDIILKYLFCILAMLVTLSPRAFSFEYAAFGDLRGHIEPCGCNPETDMGGIERIAGFLELERSRYKDLEVYSLGSNFHHDKFTVTDSFIEKALKKIGPVAALFGKTELLNRRKIDESLYLLTNQKKSDKFKKLVETDRSIVFGLLEFEDYKVSDKDIEFILKKTNGTSKKKVLLYSGSKSSLNKIMEKLKVDITLTANFRRFEEDADGKERKNESLLKYSGVKITPLGGQGLAIKGITEVSLKNFKESSSSSSSSIPGMDIFSNSSTSENEFVWLDRKRLYASSLSDFMKEYRIASKNSFKKLVLEKLKFKNDSQYVGSEACKDCHSSAYEVFKNSSHFKAYETLKNKLQHENESCVGCHVVGFDKKGGFISEEHSPHLKGVGCEQCHGPRKDHIKNPVKFSQKHLKDRAKTLKDVCSTCHHPPHTVGFDRESYWRKFRHGK